MTQYAYNFSTPASSTARGWDDNTQDGDGSQTETNDEYSFRGPSSKPADNSDFRDHKRNKPHVFVNNGNMSGVNIMQGNFINCGGGGLHYDKHSEHMAREQIMSQRHELLLEDSIFFS